jgi:hypothetical protein
LADGPRRLDRPPAPIVKLFNNRVSHEDVKTPLLYPLSNPEGAGRSPEMRILGIGYTGVYDPGQPRGWISRSRRK